MFFISVQWIIDSLGIYKLGSGGKVNDMVRAT